VDCVYIYIYILSNPPVDEGGTKKIVNGLRVHMPKFPPFLGTRAVSASHFIRL
jgi:hypothetical protein